MSVIQKIRTKYAKLAGGVIAVALVAFILMDALSSRTSSLFGNDTSVVKVNGEKVDYMDYSRRTSNYNILYGSNKQLDDNGRAQINSMALQDMIKEKLIEEEAEKLGLTVTEAEKKNMIYGNDPDKAVKNYQAFQNPNTKAFDPQYVKLFEEQANQIDPTGGMMEHWMVYKDYVVRNSMINKYNKLFTMAAYVPSFLSQARADEQANMVDIKYVAFTQDDLNAKGDIEKTEVTDEDYKRYMNNHKEEFYVKEPTRTIQYVSFDVLPDAKDTARALGVLTSIKDNFSTAEDIESFVNRNSDESYRASYVMKDSYQSRYSDSIFSSPTGTVIGPLYEEQGYKLIKVVDKKMYPDSVKCRHILIKTGEQGQLVLDDSTAKNRIDSIVAAIKGGTSFNEMVEQYSDDQGSKQTGGEYTFAFEQKANLTKPFGEFIFENKTGDKKVVKVESGNYTGYHYIEILRQDEMKPALKLATITKALYAGDETENEIYARATEFAGNSTSAAEFDKGVNDNKYQVRTAGDIKVYDYTIYGIGPSRELIRWMYDAEQGDVSQVFDMNGKYVVAKLTQVNKEGMKELTDEMRDNMAIQVKEQKRMEMMAEKYKDAKSLETVAQDLSKEVQTMDSIRGNNSFTGPLGYAPKVVGYAHSKSFKPNTVSGPINEQSGLYFISVTNRYKQSSTDSTFATREKEMMQMEMRNGFDGQAAEQLKKNAKLKYNPDNF